MRSGPRPSEVILRRTCGRNAVRLDKKNTGIVRTAHQGAGINSNATQRLQITTEVFWRLVFRISSRASELNDIALAWRSS